MKALTLEQAKKLIDKEFIWCVYSPSNESIYRSESMIIEVGENHLVTNHEILSKAILVNGFFEIPNTGNTIFFKF